MVQEIKKAIIKNSGEKTALFFSGGLDSSIIAKILKDNNEEFKCFTTGISESKDIEWAKIAAEKMDLDLEIIKIKDYEKYLDKVMKEFNFTNSIDLSISIPFFIACERASKYSSVGITGLGADEIFAGYGSHRKAYPNFKKVQEECENRLEIVKNDLKRDNQISSYFGMKLSNEYFSSKKNK